MDRYVGCDPHADSCTFSVRAAKGKVVRRDVVETDGEALVGYLRGLGGRIHLCTEEGEWSQWLAELLAPYVAEFVVVQPERKRGSKSDRIDADGLSEQILTGQLGQVVFKDRGRFTALRELTRAYRMVGSDVARTKNRIKAMARGRGVHETGSALYDTERRGERIRSLPEATQWAVELLGRELTFLEALKKEARGTMVRASHRHSIARILESAPGLGPVRVAQLIPIVITPHRFRTKRQFWKYCGFGIVTRTSSDWVLYDGRWIRARVEQTRGLNPNCNRRLKALFKGAATTVLARRSDAGLCEHYDRLLENGTKPNLAKLTIARKIAAITLAMWKNKEVYRPEKVTRTPTTA